MSQTLIRKCDTRNCSTIMVIEADIVVISLAASQKPKLLGYKNVECKVGCILGFRVAGCNFNLPIANKSFIKAVYCSSCHTVRHLRLFEEVKL